MSNPLRSSTHQNVTIGVLLSGGVTTWLIGILRANAPSLVTWDVSVDATIVGFAAGILGPFASRQLAFLRDPDKAADFRPFGEIKEGVLNKELPEAYTNSNGVHICERPPKEPKPAPPEDA